MTVAAETSALAGGAASSSRRRRLLGAGTAAEALIDMFFPEPLQAGVERHDGSAEFVKLGGGAQPFEKGDGATGTGSEGGILMAGEQADFLSEQLRADSGDGVEDMGLDGCERIGPQWRWAINVTSVARKPMICG